MKFDAIVIGAGVVGLTTALALTKRQLSVALVDAGSALVKENQRVYAINLSSENLFRDLGVWSLLSDSKISEYEHMHVWDANGRGQIDFDARDIACPKLGSIIAESALKKALIELLERENLLTFYFESKVVAINTQDRSIELENSNQLSAKLLFITDGAKSSSRKLLKIPVTSWSYDQEAIIATIELEMSHNKTAFQRFAVDGPLAFLPLKDSHQASIVWSTSPAFAKNLVSLDETKFAQNLEEAFESKLGKLKLLSERQSFPLHMIHVKQYVGPSWLLLGDAAHSIHPMAGLGLNIGLSDLRSWLSLMQPSKLNSERVLKEYQRERKQALWKVITLLSGLKYLFSSTLPPLVVLRTVGLAFCSNFTPIKRLFIEYAGGKI